MLATTVSSMPTRAVFCDSSGESARIFSMRSDCRKSEMLAVRQSLPCVKGGGTAQAVTEGLIQRKLVLCYIIPVKSQLLPHNPPSQKSKIFASPLYTRGPLSNPTPVQNKVFRHAEDGPVGPSFHTLFGKNRERATRQHPWRTHGSDPPGTPGTAGRERGQSGSRRIPE